jgi:Uma2 family endonuclease
MCEGDGGFQHSLGKERLNPSQNPEYNSVMGVEVVPKLTFEQFRQLPDDGRRYELVRGEVHLTPSPTTKHQLVLRRLSTSLDTFISKNRLGEVMLALSMFA